MFHEKYLWKAGDILPGVRGDPRLPGTGLRGSVRRPVPPRSPGQRAPGEGLEAARVGQVISGWLMAAPSCPQMPLLSSFGLSKVTWGSPDSDWRKGCTSTDQAQCRPAKPENTKDSFLYPSSCRDTACHRGAVQAKRLSIAFHTYGLYPLLCDGLPGEGTATVPPRSEARGLALGHIFGW